MRYKIRILEDKDSEHCIESFDNWFNEELVQFVCPVRLASFLDEHKDKYLEVDGFDDGLDFVSIDLSKKNREISEFQVKNGVINYIAYSTHLDRYGVESFI